MGVGPLYTPGNAMTEWRRWNAEAQQNFRRYENAIIRERKSCEGCGACSTRRWCEYCGRER